MTDNTEQLLHHLISIGKESEYLEFKENFDKEVVGERISAIANSVALTGREFGYIVFGVEDKTFRIVGTSFDPQKNKVGNEPIMNWLHQRVEPRTDFEFSTCSFEGKNVVLLKIPAAIERPVLFNKVAYIRIGEVTRKLGDFPQKERRIWNNQKNRNFEKGIAHEGVSESEVLKLLDYDKYFQLTKQDLPTKTELFVEKMSQDHLVTKSDDGSYKITVLGAVLLARDISNFPSVARKKIRVITYKGNNKDKRESEKEWGVGYAAGFESLVDYINTQVPNNEEIKKALRVERRVYPEIAIREFIANALIHQDFSIQGTGPLIEIFDNRIEITNPGAPLIDIDRFIDHPAQSRNETLASLMRRFGFCEESGSGVDRALSQIEIFQLPAPKFETYDDFTRVVLFAHRPLKDMTEDDRVRACYQHCVLRYISGLGKMTNASLRGRFGIDESNYPAASKIIKSSLGRGVIKEAERSKEYIPWWA